MSLLPVLFAAVRFVIIDPGHFHAALVLNRDYPEADKDVYVFAPAGADVDAHAKLVEGFNARAKDPTSWRETIYRGDDYLAKFRAWAKSGEVDPKSCVVVLAGRNNRKGDYCLAAVKAGFNVLSDKPMAITPEVFAKTRQAARLAARKGLLFSDIMTERNEITTILQRALVADAELYGEQEKGSKKDPAVSKISVHHFCKLVDGKPLRRPGWYYDTNQQGQAITDVTTHLADLVQWELFPGVTLSNAEVKVAAARTWPTPITAADYKTSTGLETWPDFLRAAVDEKGVLQCLANGEFTYSLRGVWAKVRVDWNFMPPAGTGDTHYSLMRGTKAEVVIRQDQTTGYKPVLFVKARQDAAATGVALEKALAAIAKTWAGVKAEKVSADEWRIAYPAAYDIGHEAHFSQVVREYLGWLKAGAMPQERRDNLLVKYQTLVKAWKKANGVKKPSAGKAGAAE